MKPELIAFGVDTVRYCLDFDQALPMVSDAFRSELVHAGWSSAHRSFVDHGEVIESYTASYQDLENSTIRAMLYNTGRSMAVEYSVPRVLSGSVANLQLATPHQVVTTAHDLLDQLVSTLPETPAPDAAGLKWRRIDTAADVAALDARPGLIAAAANFVIPGARKVTRQTFPGETGRASSRSLTFRGYDKALELEHKAKKNKVDLTEQIGEYMRRGAVRLELAQTPKTGSFTTGDLAKSNITWAEVMTHGFSGGKITVGGLDHIRGIVDGNASLSPQTRSSILAFAVRLAVLGEDGMTAAYSKSAYYRWRKKFLDAGLNLSDISTYSGDIDLTGVLDTVKRGA